LEAKRSSAGESLNKRMLINWRQVDLATGVSEIAIKNVEQGATDPHSSTMEAIQAA
jgi:hypothetical protein